MRKFKLFVLLLGIFSFLGLVSVKAVPTNIDVDLHYYLDGVEQTDKKHTLLAQPVGQHLILAEPITLEVGDPLQPQQFLFWVVNGAVRTDLGPTLNIKVPTELKLEAYFTSPNKKAAVFLDTNLKLLGATYATGGTPETPAVPGKPLSTPDGWALIDSYETKATIAEITTASPLVTYYVARYKVETAEVAGSLTVDSAPQVEKLVNQVVTLDSAPTGFSHWVDGEGNILSYKANYSFTMLKENRVINSVLGTPTPEPLVNMVVEPNLRGGYTSVVGQFEANSGYSILEYGFLISRSLDDITHESLGVTVVKSNTSNALTNEFLKSFKNGSFNTIRAYAIFDNGATKVTKYSDKLVGGKQEVLATDLFISEYIEGSSNNKAIEIYNGTGSSVDLSAYSVSVYTNGSSTASKTVGLTGTLAHGEVYVIAHGSAAAAILAEADATDNGMDFNGDDAVALIKNEIEIDVFGVIGERPSTGWPAGSGTTANQTLVRKSTISGPTTTWNVDEWDVYPVDTFTYLGSHTMHSVFVKHEVEYNVEGVKTTEFVNDGSLITFVPEKLGYVFDGWYLDSGHLTAFDVANPVNQSLKLYAKFTFVEYSITFNSNGGTAVASINNIAPGTVVTKPADPTKADHAFVGWYEEATFNTPFDFSTPINKDYALHAKWVDLTLSSTVTEMWASNPANNDSVILVGVVAATTDKGYILQDTTNGKMVSVHDSVNTPTKGDKLYISGTFSVSYNISRVLVETKYDVISTGNTINYTKTTAVDIDFNTFAVADYQGKLVKVESPWIKFSGTSDSSYIRIGGTLSGVEVASYDGGYIGILIGQYNANLTVPAATAYPTTTTTTQYVDKALYIFFYDSSSSYKKAIIIGDDHVETLTTYTVTFNSNGGSAVDQQTVVSGKTATEPVAPTKSGAEFAGWYSNPELTNAYVFSTPVTADITLYAKWTAVATHTVTFNSNGGSAVSPQTVNDGATATEPAAPTKSGYLFDGWYTDAATTTLYNFSTAVTSDITLHAKWIEKPAESTAILSGAAMSEALGTTSNTSLNDGTEYTGTPNFDYATGLGLDTSIFNVTFAKNSANAWAANGGSLRGYYNASGGGSITIDMIGHTITKIVINLKGANNVGNNALLVNEVEYAFYISHKASGTDIVTVTNLNTSSVTIQCNHTNRMYIESIEITYVPNP